MTWWLSATGDELRAASTCTNCGCPDADIDLNLCFDCFSRLSEVQQLTMLRNNAVKYRLPERVMEFELKLESAFSRQAAAQVQELEGD